MFWFLQSGIAILGISLSIYFIHYKKQKKQEDHAGIMREEGWAEPNLPNSPRVRRQKCMNRNPVLSAELAASSAAKMYESEPGSLEYVSPKVFGNLSRQLVIRPGRSLRERLTLKNDRQT